MLRLGSKLRRRGRAHEHRSRGTAALDLRISLALQGRAVKAKGGRPTVAMAHPTHGPSSRPVSAPPPGPSPPLLPARLIPSRE